MFSCLLTVPLEKAQAMEFALILACCLISGHPGKLFCLLLVLFVIKRYTLVFIVTFCQASARHETIYCLFPVPLGGAQVMDSALWFVFCLL